MNDTIARLFPDSQAWTGFWTTLEFGREAKTSDWNRVTANIPSCWQ